MSGSPLGLGAPSQRVSVPPPRILAAVRDPARRARLHEAARAAIRLRLGEWRVVEAKGAAEALRQCALRPPALLILDPTPADSGEVERALHAFPNVPTLLYMKSGEVHPERILELGRLGVTGVVEWGRNDRPSVLAELLLRSWGGGRGQQLLSALLLRLPGEFHSLVRRAYLEVGVRGGRDLTVDRFTWLWRPGAHRTTLALATRRYGLPSPGWLVRYLVALRAAEALSNPGSTVSQVALGMGFDSDAALREFFRRLAGRPPSAVTPEFLLSLLDRRIGGKEGVG